MLKDEVYWNLSPKRKFLKNVWGTPLVNIGVLFFLLAEPFHPYLNIGMSIFLIISSFVTLLITYRNWQKDEANDQTESIKKKGFTSKPWFIILSWVLLFPIVTTSLIILNDYLNHEFIELDLYLPLFLGFATGGGIVSIFFYFVQKEK